MAREIQLIGASAVISCNKHFEIIKNGGILFSEDKILKVGDYESLKSPKIPSKFYESCVITPAFINPHIHFEFSGNASTLNYGNFGVWLDSVMKNRNDFFNDSDSIKDGIKEVLRTGTASVGAISSTGADLEALSTSPLKVVYFNEIMGTSAERIEQIKERFEARFKKAKLLENPRFKNAIALHSPYALHSDLADYAIDIARRGKMLVTTHLLESREELIWLDYGKGYFKDFFKNSFGVENARPFYTKREFMELFSQVPTLFTHCLYLSNDDFELLQKLDSDIISAPHSNRLLNNRYFDFFKAKDFKFKLILATDGKSSNHSLSQLDEARCALFAYRKFDVNALAKEIMLGITRNVAKRFGFNNGSLERGKASDLAVFYVKDIAKSSQVPLHFLLHAREVEDLYINGKRIEIESI